MSAPIPGYRTSTLIKEVIADRFRIHKADGDMWPVTWAADGNIYGAAGDNMDSPLNIWRFIGHPDPHYSWFMYAELVNRMPVDPSIYCQRPGVDSKRGLKPASIISIGGIFYLAVELHNYGDNPSFNRQRNISSWIVASNDYGVSWKLDITLQDFFEGRLSSPHFLQFGKDYEDARDEYVYAYFPVGDDGNSYWCNGDGMLLGRVNKDKLLVRDEWEFYSGTNKTEEPVWNKNDSFTQQVFSYQLMTGENHVVYNKGLKRYVMGNYSFIDENGNPRPYHQCWPQSAMISQLTLFEAPEPWGPWSLFYRDDKWGTYGDYQPNFPGKWISEDGRTMWMVSSGSYDDYNLTVQKLILVLDE